MDINYYRDLYKQATRATHFELIDLGLNMKATGKLADLSGELWTVTAATVTKDGWAEFFSKDLLHQQARRTKEILEKEELARYRAQKAQCQCHQCPHHN